VSKAAEQSAEGTLSGGAQQMLAIGPAHG